MSRAVRALALATLVMPLASGAELLPRAAHPGENGLRITFEILPAESGTALPEELRTVEGGRLTVEDAWARGERYRRTTFVFPFPEGETRELVFYFAEDDERLRLIGFHKIRRRGGMPEGETIVFNPGPELPLQGRGVTVPPDTYTWLALFTALGGVVTTAEPITAHLWREEGGAVAVRIRPDGAEDLELFGTRVPSRRIAVETGKSPAGGTYWLSAAPPHHFLQYRGPADLVAAASDSPPVLVRATSSSEQVRQVFEDLEPEPD